MSDSFVRLPVDGVGKLLDCSQLTVGANTVQRERMIIGDNVANNYVTVSATGGALVDQGVAAAINAPWPVELSDGSAALGTGTNPLRVDPIGTTIQPVSWSGQSVVVTQGTGSNLHAVIDSGTITTVATVTAVTAITNALPAGTNAIGVVSTKTGLTASAPTAFTVGVTTAQALASASTRKGLVLTNLSTNIISLGLGAAAVLNNGITLSPSGGVWVMDEYTFFTGAINAIASGASSNLSIQEFTT